MAHFAQLNKQNEVINVTVVDNADLLNLEFPDSEIRGQALLNTWFPNPDDSWKQTSYNDNFRGRLATIGGTYDPVNDVFIAPQPWDTWVLNPVTFEWEAPVPIPDGLTYEDVQWDPYTNSWKDIRHLLKLTY